MNNNKDKEIWRDAERLFPDGVPDYAEKRENYRRRRRADVELGSKV